jgi:uncharacterized membrane protein
MKFLGWLRTPIILATLTLAGCASAPQRMEPQAYAPQVRAYCAQYAQSATTGYWAAGSIPFVAGMMLAGTVINGVSSSAAYNSCMAAHGSASNAPATYGSASNAPATWSRR